jgi:hypothetical protein
MRICLWVIFLMFFSAPCFSQQAEEAAVMLPVTRLFQGMKLGDSAMVHSAFMKHVTFITIGQDKTGKPIFRDDSLNDFLVAVGTPHPETWNEMTWAPEVRIDGNFAQVYEKFAFYLGKNLSHCGIDAFHLFKGADGSWRIFHLADTHQREKCEVPVEISGQFK